MLLLQGGGNIESKIINFLLEKDKPVKLNELLKETDIDTKNLKQSLLDNSVKSNTEISKFWDTVDFNSLLN